MKVTIIGNGIVGKSTAIQILGGSEFHDPHYDMISDYKNADVVFICVPTDLKDDNLDTTIVESYLDELQDHPFVYIRSTVPHELVKDTNFAVFPEFLRERKWKDDSLNSKVNIVGGNREQFIKLLGLTGNYDLHRVSNVEASLIKMSINSFLAYKVYFANQLHNYCQDIGLDYDIVKNGIKKDKRMGKSHWDVPGPDGFKGFGGKCLPKDFQSFTTLLDNDIFQSIINNNER